ncbi:MAG: cytochrome P450, partial [Pseudomonadota bacterium]
IVSRHDDFRAVVQNSRDYSNDLSLLEEVANPPQEARDILKSGYSRPQTLQRSDPPAHSRYRRVINRAFTAKRVRDMKPYIDRVVSDLIDEMIGAPEVDFVEAFATPLPCIVIADQMGVPREDTDFIKEWTNALLDPVGLMITDERNIECARQTVEFQNYFAERIAERRDRPRDDILTDLVAEMDDDEAPLSTEEVLNILEQLMTGGNETTTNTLSSALLLLIQNPEQERRLRDDPDLIPNFVEEVLRVETPVQGLFRRAVRDIEIRNVTIPKDAVVMVRHGAANRDESVFEDSEAFDVCRKNAGDHVTFGGGVHICPGRLLARAELNAAFTQLLDRFEKFELVEEKNTFEYHPNFFLRGLNELHVRLTPKAA